MRSLSSRNTNSRFANTPPLPSPPLSLSTRGGSSETRSLSSRNTNSRFANTPPSTLAPCLHPQTRSHSNRNTNSRFANTPPPLPSHRAYTPRHGRTAAETSTAGSLTPHPLSPTSWLHPQTRSHSSRNINSRFANTPPPSPPHRDYTPWLSSTLFFQFFATFPVLQLTLLF